MCAVGADRKVTAIASSTGSFTEVTRRLRAAGCVFAEDEARLLLDAASTPTELERMVSRRVEGLPLEHILGWVEFAGLRVAVDAGVFVPRRRTEFLARRAAELTGPSGTAIDLCCGAGAVGAAMLALYPHIDLYASDIDPHAVASARRNLPPERVFEGDLYAPLPTALRARVGVIVANAPYVPTAEIAMMPPEARLHEASVALDGGDDGLDLHRRVAAEAPRWLAPGGYLLVEASVRQAPVTRAIFERSGFVATVEHCDDLDATIVLGRLAP